ncbi:MAG: hypothetical protein Q6L60_06850 [Thermostichus sp. HHBFW_bins_43]
MPTTTTAKSAMQRVKSMMQKFLRASHAAASPRRKPMIRIGSLLALPVLLLALPSWALTLVARPDLRTLKRAEVLRVLNYNTLVVQIEGELDLRLVQLIGIDPLPPRINPNWTELREQTPLAVYNAGQYLQDALLRREVFLELDAALAPAPTLPAYVWQANTLINQEMLFLGHGLLSPQTDGLKYGTVLTEAAAAGERQGRGYWTTYGPR